jgi:hypothetical protein
MRFRGILIVVLFLLIPPAVITAQENPAYSSRFENGRLMIQIDRNTAKDQRTELENLFNLDSTIWEKLSPDVQFIISDSIQWKVRQLSGTQFELSRQIENKPLKHLDIDDIFLLDFDLFTAPGYVDQEKVIFGVNGFKAPECFNYDEGHAVFFLPGYPRAHDVNIAGSFNSWNPISDPMIGVDSGWIFKTTLDPGKYFYKYIVDGNWITDPNNDLKENDGVGNINSVVYCTNYNFYLPGFPDAKRVILAGSFNKWNQKELKMKEIAGGWDLPVYLGPGTFMYKFIVDNKWMTDPANPVILTDGSGNQNSVISRGIEHKFFLSGYNNVRQVVLTGNFLNWDPNGVQMNKTAEGWELIWQFAPGNYEYKFIVDGSWIPDPDNPYLTGKENIINSCFSIDPNYEFSLGKFPDATEVRLTGSFNNWDPFGYIMVRKEGKWTYPLHLGNGKHLYKYIVDGEWIIDPENRLWENNEYGTGNSILWIGRDEGY